MDMYEIVKKNPVLAILRNIPLEKTIDYAQAVVDGGITFFEVALNLSLIHISGICILITGSPTAVFLPLYSNSHKDSVFSNCSLPRRKSVIST